MQFKFLISAIPLISFGAANTVVDKGISMASNFLSTKYLASGADASAAYNGISNVLKTVANSTDFTEFATAAATQLKSSAANGFNAGEVVHLVGMFAKAMTGFMSSVNYGDWVNLVKETAKDINITGIIGDITSFLRGHALTVAKAAVKAKDLVDNVSGLSEAVAAAATPAMKMASDIRNNAVVTTPATATAAYYIARTTSVE